MGCSALSTLKKNRGFNMIELMVVVVIVGLLSAVAVPIYVKYARNSRITEATGRIGELLTAAKSYAVEFEDNGDPDDAVWPDDCNVAGFFGDCRETRNFTYYLAGQRNGLLKIVASGKSGTAAGGVEVRLEVANPAGSPVVTMTGF